MSNKISIATILSFRIKNYRSILDSGIILVPANDRIFVLAGQNESGKTSIISALSDFEIGEYDGDTRPFGLSGGFQEIECTYKIIDNKLFLQMLAEEIAKEKTETAKVVKIFSEKLKIDQLTLTRKFDFKDGVSSFKIDDHSLEIIKSAVRQEEKTAEDGTKSKEPVVNIVETEVVDIIWRMMPAISFFKESDILPDKILISDLKSKNDKASGYSAVKNFENIANIDLVNLAEMPIDAERLKAQNVANDIISVNFQESWRQRIYGNNSVRVKFEILRGVDAQQYVNFYIETKDNEFLAPRQRSKGLVWFLSFWLDLKATVRENSPQIILIDEPGLYLHIKAQKDFLDLLQFLAGDKEKNQVIYSTHLPALINTDYLYRIGLVVNSEKSGTTVEKLTSSLFDTDNKKDALQPIAEAMGLSPLKDFSILKQKNVILEGLSDFHYFKAMKSMLRPSADYDFVPGIGIKEGRINHLISFCIGYGLDWVVILDGSKGSPESFKVIKNEIFNGNEELTKLKVKILENFNGIEDLFTCDDLSLIGEHINCAENKSKAKVVGDSRKILFSQIFHQKVNSGEITKSKIKKSTIDNFEEIFKFLDVSLSLGIELSK